MGIQEGREGEREGSDGDGDMGKGDGDGDMGKGDMGKREWGEERDTHRVKRNTKG